MVGQTISHYRILEKLGEGAMGVVYKAEDTKLERMVALKFLAPHLLRDDDGRKRFHREAKAAAWLDHPNICAVYEIDEAEERTFIVMPLVDGRPLSRRIAEGPLKLAEALSIAVQVAEGLQAAHQKGVIHRDIKPDNLILAGGSRGVVKILDFGLASLSGTSKLTEAGITLGTAAYMSPQQAGGGETDRRTDYWSLGVVLYEMIAGTPPFQGESDQALIYAILNHTPEPLSAVRTGVPRDLDRVVAKCLSKKPDQRYQHAADLVVDLEALRRDSSLRQYGVAPASTGGRTSRYIAGGAAVALAIALLGWWLSRSTSAPAAVTQYKLRQLTRDSGYCGEPAISPNGQLVAYTADRGGSGGLDIWVRQVAGGDPIQLTNSPAPDTTPSFSPDSSQIVFASEMDGGGIFVIPALGGIVRRSAENGVQPRFSPDGQWISFVRFTFGSGNDVSSSAYVVPASGGAARSVTSDLVVVRAPIWSPDGKYLLATGTKDRGGIGLEPNFDWWILPVEGGKAIPLKANARLAKAGIADLWLPTPSVWMQEGNRILFYAGIGDGAQNLWQIPLVPGQWRWAGEPARLTSGTGEVDPSAAANGRIVFTSSSADLDIWALPLDANSGTVRGERRKAISGLGNESYPTLSTDGRRLLYLSDRTGNSDVWLHDFTTGKEIPVTIGAPLETRAAISPDGTRAAFVRREERKVNLYVTDLAGLSEKKLLDGVGNLMDWTTDGKRILYYTPPPITWRMLKVETGETTTVDIQHPRHPIHDLRWSPDGNWVAFKLFIDTPRFGPMFIASAKGGKMAPESAWIPIGDKLFNGRNWWSPNGQRLYFLSRRDGFWCIWSQRLDPATRKPAGEIAALQHFHGRSVMNPGYLGYAMSADRLYFPLAEFKGNIWLAEPQ